MCGCGPGCSAPAAARGLGVSPLRSAGDSAPGAATKRAVHAGPRGPGRRDTRPWTHGLRTAGPWSLGRAAATSFTAPSRTAARVRGARPVPGPVTRLRSSLSLVWSPAFLPVSPGLLTRSPKQRPARIGNCGLGRASLVWSGPRHPLVVPVPSESHTRGPERPQTRVGHAPWLWTMTRPSGCPRSAPHNRQLLHVPCGRASCRDSPPTTCPRVGAGLGPARPLVRSLRASNPGTQRRAGSPPGNTRASRRESRGAPGRSPSLCVAPV